MSLLDILENPDLRDRSFESWAVGKSFDELIAEAHRLEAYRATAESLYDKVRALLYLSNLHQYHIVPLAQDNTLLPYSAVVQIRDRHYERAISELRSVAGNSPALSSALAAAYRGLAFQTLAEQVRRSVRSFPGNQWMFRLGHHSDYPMRLVPTLVAGRPFPVLHESTPVRMDLSHSAWSDIFFLAMDFPEGARVINISVDLANQGSGNAPKPPIETFLRVIDEPIIRLVSVDLEARADITTIDEVFDVASDYLGLLKAALIASGIIPSGFEGSRQPLKEILYRLTGSRELGIELVSQVNEIPKGSRLAVSTNLLGSLISVLMRATGQIRNFTGPLSESDRRQVAARAILSEWLGGSGGGWQDSGGIWPGIKLIEGVLEDQPVASRGQLLPRHTPLEGYISTEAQKKLEESLVLVHGGMSQDVGPILEMCTERYLLRSDKEWKGRLDAISLFDELLAALRAGDIKELARLTQRNYEGPIQTIIPWAANAYTEALIDACRERFVDKFWGFWMLGGMSGGGMGFVFDPSIRAAAAEAMVGILASVKQRFEHAIPFAITPVVYDFAINRTGTDAELNVGTNALLSRKYHLFTTPPLLRVEARNLPEERRSELGRVAESYPDITAGLFERLFPKEQSNTAGAQDLDQLLGSLGFDPEAHERLRADYLSNRIGLAKNILPPNVSIQNVQSSDLLTLKPAHASTGRQALREGRAAVVTLAGGVGSRWTKGAGTVKALIPFHRFLGRYYNFLEVHLRKTEVARQHFGSSIPHIVTTSYLTGQPIEASIHTSGVYVSSGRSIGLRFIPTLADLRYLWEVLPQQQLDEQKQKVRASGRAGLMRWVEQMKEASDYRANLPHQCIHPVGHWYEIPNLLRNGLLARLLSEQPKLEYLLVHNVDTLGVSLDETLLGNHIESGAAFTVEVVLKQFGDHGGSLARVDRKPRLVEGLALPSEEAEFGLSYYNASTYWITIDKLLQAFGLTREALNNPATVDEAVRRTAQRVPSYITIKDVKKRWGRGQEDIYPVAQFEKLWGDMTALEEIACNYVEVPRRRGQQLKEVSQLDTWLRDGSAGEIEESLQNYLQSVKL